MKKIIKQYLHQNLNEQQFEAATWTKTSSLILAWAGSWKTRTLTYKLAYLILGESINPSNILAVTFTNKAANEMKERIIGIIEEIWRNSEEILKNKNEITDFDEIITSSLKQNSSLNFFRNSSEILKNLRIWTFHSIFLRILKQDIDKLEKWYNSNFTIYDSDDSLKLIKDIIKTLKLADELDPKKVKSKISERKNNWLTYQAAAYKVWNNWEELALKVYEKYQKELEKANALDFDDLLLLPYILFRLKPEILEKRHKKFKHILVDEAQDTNRIQFELIKMLSYGANKDDTKDLSIRKSEENLKKIWRNKIKELSETNDNLSSNLYSISSNNNSLQTSSDPLQTSNYLSCYPV